MRKLITPYMAKVLSGNTLLNCKRWVFEIYRRLTKQSHRLEIFLSISDPYSYLLLQVLPELQERFDLELHLFTVRDKQAEMFPDASKWQANSLIDGKRLAELYSLEFIPTESPASFSNETSDHYTKQLLRVEKTPQALIFMRGIFDDFWLNNPRSV